jgi:surface protein
MEIAIGNMITSSSQMNGAIASGGGGGETKFVIEVTIDNTDPSGDRDFTFYSQGPSPNYNIDWGDSSSDSGITANSKSHTYAANGVYEIKIDGTFGIAMYSGLLVDRNKITKLKNWGTSEAKLLSLYQAFSGCANMTYEATDYPDLTNLDSAVNNKKLYRLFYQCDGLTAVDVSNWQNTDNITSLQQMFSATDNVTSINMTGWDTSNVTTFSQMFNAAGWVSKNVVITLPNFDVTGTTTGLANMFQFARCTSIDVSGWTFNSGANYDLYRMFYKIWVATIDLSTWVNCKVSRAKDMFRDPEDLTTINITGLDFTPNTDLERFVSNADLLTTFTGISGLVTTNNTNCLGTFQGLKVYDWSNENLRDDKFNVNFGSTTDMSSMFNTVGFTTPTPPPNVSGLDTSAVTTMNQSFINSKFTTTLDLSGWDMSANTTLYRFLYNNDGITSVDASSWAFTNALTTMEDMIRGSEVTDIEFGSSSDFSGITTFQSFSLSTNSLTSIDFPTNADFSSVTNMTNFMGAADAHMSTAEYDNFLVRFNATNSNSGMTLSFGLCQYTTATSGTAHAAIIARGNTIIDNGGI